MITLYDKSATNFEYNGIGSLDQDIINPKIHWIDNGIFSFEFEYPLFAKHGLEITNSSIIKARDSEQDNLFFVYKVIPSMGYIKVYCYHIFYKLAFNTINDTNIVGKNGQGALTQLAGATQYPHKFQLTSDLTNIANSRVVRKNPVEILLDSNLDNSFINRWGGHIIRHGFNISMNQSYGSNKGYKIQHKKDLMGYEATIDETTVVTRIRPVGYDGLLLPEIYIDSPLINNYPEPRIQEYAYSDVKIGKGEGEFATAALAYAELRRLAKLEFSQNEIDVPRGIYKVDFVNLKETEEYKNFAPLKQILPGDIVAVEHEEDGISIRSQMVEYNWDPLLKEYIDLTLGNYERSFTSTINKLDKIQTDIKDIHNQIELVYMSANGKNKIYSGETEPIIDQNSTEGDLWFKKNGDKTELWTLHTVNGVLQWVVELSDATQEELKAAVNDAILQAEIDRTKAEQDFEAAKQTAKEYTDAQVIAFDTKFEAETGAIRNEVTTGYNNAIANGKAYTDNKSAEFNTQLDLVKADVASTVLKADDAVIKANKAITDVGFMRIDIDATKVTAIDALTKAQTATDNVNSLSTSYDALTQTVSFKAERTQVNAINGVVDQHELKISANAQAITARLTSVQVDSLITGKGYVNQAQLTATSSQWNLALTQVSTDLSNLEIGGRNYFKNSEKEVTGSREFINSTNWDMAPIIDKYGLVSYTISFDLKSAVAGNINVYSQNGYGARYGMGSHSVYATTEYKRFSVTFIPTNGNLSLTQSLLAFYGQAYGNGRIPSVKNVKMEIGNKATDWSPAPEDMTTLEQFTTLDVKVNGIQTTVGNKADKTEITQLANQWTQTTALANGHTGQISNLGEQLNFRVGEVQTSLNNLEIGGRNLIIRYNEMKGTILVTTGLPGAGSGSTPREKIAVIPKEVLVLSKTASGDDYWRVSWFDINGNYISRIPSTANEWKFVVPDNAYFIWVSYPNDSEVKLERGNKKTGWSPAPEDMADKASILAQINLSSEGVLIQGKRIQLDGDVAMNAAFITRLDTQTLTAVTANIASIRTSMLTADVITSTHLKVDNAMMDKLAVNTAVVNYLFTKTAFVDNLNAKTLNAVTANIATIRSQVLVTNSVTATHVLGDVAMINNLFATTALIDTLTSKSAFIANIKAIDIAADRITAGTLNAALVNIINLNASRISTGTITGANSAWNLNTGNMLFRNPSTGDDLYLRQGEIEFQNGSQGRYLRYQNEGLKLVPFAENTGVNKNTALHLVGGGTGSYQYIQFLSAETGGISQRLQAEGNSLSAMHAPGGLLLVKAYGADNYSGIVRAARYETTASDGLTLEIQGDQIRTPRVGSRNLFLTPQGTGAVIAGAPGNIRYNVNASDFVKQSSRTTKTNIVPLTEGLGLINRLTPVSYNKIDKLNQGIIELEKGFISEDSFGVSTPDGKGIYDSHITAYLVKAVQEMDQKVIAIGSLTTAANTNANNAMNKVFQIDNDVQIMKNKIITFDSLATKATNIATNAMNKAIQADGEVQQMKNKIIELEKEIKTLKGAA